MMSQRLEQLASALLALAAIAIAIVVVRRELVGEPAAHHLRRKPQYISEWKEVVRAGKLLGKPDAAVKLVEFMDFECPFCRDYNARIRRLAEQHDDDVAIVLVHYPLSNHRFARPAARAAECASNEGRFWKFVDVLYDKQDSLGLKQWTSFAVEAGIRDTTAFGTCVRDTAAVHAIEAGVAIGKRIGVNATPTVLFNEWLLPAAPSDTQLVRAISDVLGGKAPYSR